MLMRLLAVVRRASGAELDAHPVMIVGKAMKPAASDAAFTNSRRDVPAVRTSLRGLLIPISPWRAVSKEKARGLILLRGRLPGGLVRILALIHRPENPAVDVFDEDGVFVMLLLVTERGVEGAAAL